MDTEVVFIVEDTQGGKPCRGSACAYLDGVPILDQAGYILGDLPFFFRGFTRSDSKLGVTQLVILQSVEIAQEIESSDRINNLEAVLGGEGAYFLFDSPKTDIDVTLAAYPNLTTWGRVRLSGNARVSYEILSDFTIGFTVFDEFDSGAPGQGDSTNDFGTTLFLGYTF